MKPETRNIFSIIAILCALTLTTFSQDRVKLVNGTLEGIADKSTGVRSFKGVPFGAPPIGDLRWKIPQPVKNWEGVRKAGERNHRRDKRALVGCRCDVTEAQHPGAIPLTDQLRLDHWPRDKKPLLSKTQRVRVILDGQRS